MVRRYCTFLVAFLCVVLLAGCVHEVRVPPEQERRGRVFDAYWRAVNEQYAYFGGDNVSWDEMRDAYRPSAITAPSELEFYRTLWMASAHLLDGHVIVEPPRRVLESAGRAGGNDLRIVSAITETTATPSGRRASGYFVIRWPEGEAPAPPPHLDADREVARLLEIEGVPYRHVSESARLLLAEPGSRVNLLLGWSDGSRSRHTLVARVVEGGANQRLPDPDRAQAEIPEEIVIDGKRYSLKLPWLSTLLATPKTYAHAMPDGSSVRVAQFRAKSFSLDGGIRRNPLAAARDHFKALLHPEGGLDADVLVLDLRENYGGRGDVVEALLDQVLVPEVEMLFTRGSRILSRTMLGGAPEGRPMVVWVDEDTLSAGEIAAAVLQGWGDAVVVGQPTLGVVGGTHSFRIVGTPDAPRMTIPSDRVTVAGVPVIQRLGVTPDIPVVVTAQELRQMKSQLGATEPADALERAHNALLAERWQRATHLAVVRAAQSRQRN